MTLPTATGAGLHFQPQAFPGNCIAVELKMCERCQRQFYRERPEYAPAGQKVCPQCTPFRPVTEVRGPRLVKGAP